MILYNVLQYKLKLKVKRLESKKDHQQKIFLICFMMFHDSMLVDCFGALDLKVIAINRMKKSQKFLNRRKMVQQAFHFLQTIGSQLVQPLLIQLFLLHQVI